MSSLRVALTFDAEHPDRPHHLVGSEDRLRETLGSLNVHGTFFVQGRWAEAFPDQARRIADDGHLIGNHSHYHAKMHLLTEAGLMEDIKTAAGAIETICKRDPAPWFRSPFGAGAKDPRVRAALEQLGYKQVLWSATGDDWDHRETAQHMEDAAVASTVEHGDGAILLFHTWPSHTHEKISKIVARLREEGATFVTVNELEPKEIPENLGEIDW